MSVFDVFPMRIEVSMNIDGLASGSKELPAKSDNSSGAQTGQRPAVLDAFTVFVFELKSVELMHGLANWFSEAPNFLETPEERCSTFSAWSSKLPQRKLASPVS